MAGRLNEDEYMISIGNFKIVESDSVRVNFFGKWYVRKFDEEEFRILFGADEYIFDDYISNLDDLVFAGFGKSATEDKYSGTPVPLEKWAYYREILLPLNLFFKSPVFIRHEFDSSTRIVEDEHDNEESFEPFCLSCGSEYIESPSPPFLQSDWGEAGTYEWRNELSAEELPKIEQFISKFDQYMENLEGKEKKNVRLVIDRFYDSIGDFAHLQNYDDACRKCIEGLEGLYLKGMMGDKKTPLAQRIGMVTHPMEERWDNYMSNCIQRVEPLYSKSSDIRHGGKPRVFNLEDFYYLRDCLRKSLLYLISLLTELGKKEVYKLIKDPFSSQNRAVIRQYRGFLLANE